MGWEKSQEYNGALPDPFLCQMCPLICGKMCSPILSLCHKLKRASYVHGLIDISTVILETDGFSVPVDFPILACTENDEYCAKCF